MTLSSGIEQQATRSLASVHKVPSPRPSIELRRIKHVHNESSTQGITSVRGDDSEGSSTRRDQTQAASLKVRKRLEVQYACLCLALFLAGWNDGTSGPLIPRIQRYYNVNFTLVSLIFIVNCIGFVAGATANVILTYKVGFGKLMVIGPICQALAYSIQAPAPPFPVFVLAPILNGFGMAIQDAQANGYVASLDNHKEVRMGVLHAVYGLGAFSAPLVSTQFSSMKHWSYHYFCSLGLAVVSAVLAMVIFRFKTQEECLLEIGQRPEEGEASEHGAYHQIFRLRAVHLMAFFILIYVGVEVTIGGWIVTYIIQVRGGGPSSGYVSSGFFGGLTFGRVALLWVNSKIGERRAIFLYSLLVLGLEVVIWRVPSLIGNAVTVSVVGVLLGPIYPIVMNHAGRILPRLLLTGSIGWIAGLGQAGSAAIPFMTGALASSTGIWTLHPLLIGMIGLLLVLWALVPGKRRTD